MTLINLKQKILTDEDWICAYPRENYVQFGAKKANKEISKHVKKFTLHYLLALEQPDTVITTFIDKKVKKKQYRYLFATNKEFNSVTPMIISTLLGRIEIVRALIKGCSGDNYYQQMCINQPGLNYWTPLHLAKITSDQIYKTLLENNANPAATTCLFGTPEDIGELVSRNLKSVSADKVIWETEDGVQFPISKLIAEGNLEKVTNLKEYRDIMYVPPYESSLQGFINETNDNEKDASTEALKKGYADYMAGKNIPKFIVAIEDECKGSKGIQVRGLKADEDLSCGRIVGPYSAAFDPPTEMHESSPYKCGNIDALQYGNHTHWMDWGFPNVGWVTFADKGINVTVTYVYQEEGIRKGEFIYLHYGSSYWYTPIYKPFIIFGKERLEKFFKPGLNTRIKEYEAVNAEKDEIKKLIKVKEIKEKIKFAVCAPCVLLYLHFKCLVSAKEWKFYLIDEPHPLFSSWAETTKEHETYQLVENTLNSLIDIDIKLQSNEKLRNYIGQLVLENIGVLTFAEIHFVLDKISKKLNEDSSLLSKKACKAFFNLKS